MHGAIGRQDVTLSRQMTESLREPFFRCVIVALIGRNMAQPGHKELSN